MRQYRSELAFPVHYFHTLKEEPRSYPGFLIFFFFFFLFNCAQQKMDVENIREPGDEANKVPTRAILLYIHVS